MIIKITDGDMSHFIEFSGGVRIEHVPSMNPEDWSDYEAQGEEAEPTAEWLHLVTIDEDDALEMHKPGIVIRPEGLPLRTYLTNMDAYLLSDKGKTVEVLHRCT